jgi:ketosteroid isomerase-like protein
VCNDLVMDTVPDIVKTFFNAWILRDPAIAAALVTDDVTIRDPNNAADGPAALVEHLNSALHHFDFDVEYGQCWGGPDDFVFLCRVGLTGRSKHFAHVQTSFEPAVFVKLRDGLIESWIEHWDPRELNAALSRP